MAKAVAAASASTTACVAPPYSKFDAHCGVVDVCSQLVGNNLEKSDDMCLADDRLGETTDNDSLIGKKNYMSVIGQED